MPAKTFRCHEINWHPGDRGGQAPALRTTAIIPGDREGRHPVTPVGQDRLSLPRSGSGDPELQRGPDAC